MLNTRLFKVIYLCKMYKTNIAKFIRLFIPVNSLLLLKNEQ